VYASKILSGDQRIDGHVTERKESFFCCVISLLSLHMQSCSSDAGLSLMRGAGLVAVFAGYFAETNGSFKPKFWRERVGIEPTNVGHIRIMSFVVAFWRLSAAAQSMDSNSG
jgi:hypothetical protein